MINHSTISERGLFKHNIDLALFKSNDIKNLLLGDTDKMSVLEVRKAFKNQVKSHLFIDETVEDTKSYIFYDVVISNIHTTMKTCRVIMYAVCHRDILDGYIREGYYGNRADILSQMIEEVLVNDETISNEFGVGRLLLDNVDIYNSKTLYGSIMTFEVPNFR